VWAAMCSYGGGGVARRAATHDHPLLLARNLPSSLSVALARPRFPSTLRLFTVDRLGVLSPVRSCRLVLLPWVSLQYVYHEIYRSKTVSTAMVIPQPPCPPPCLHFLSSRRWRWQSAPPSDRTQLPTTSGIKRVTRPADTRKYFALLGVPKCSAQPCSGMPLAVQSGSTHSHSTNRTG
jgi:hypothetical protein